MPREQLVVMVKNLRAECGHSLSAAQGTNQVDTLKYLLARTQEELWTAFTWPELVTRANVPLNAGQYLYDFPATMPFDQIRESYTAQPSSNEWIPLDYGIGEDLIKPDGSNVWQADPVQIWDIESAAQFRVSPTPAVSGGYVRFKGNKPLDPFQADADYSTLDDNVIVLFAAADLLARAKAEDAPSKQQKAQRHLSKLLANRVSAKQKVSTVGGGAPGLNSKVGNLSRSSTTWYSGP
jgi:hypothetical protein